MKTILAYATLLFSFLPLYGQLTQPEEMPPQPKQLSEEELLATWGWLVAERYNLRSFNFNPVEMEQITEGMKSHVRGEEPPTDLRGSMTQMQRYFTEREERMNQKALIENRAEGQAFFDELVGVPGIKSLGTGLHYQILNPGNEKKPKPSDTVAVRYEGRFLDNTVFDSTEGRQPAVFKLNEVIQGWTQGLQLIGEGGKIKLFVPAKLGYGDEPRPGVPPASTLVFEVELLKVGVPEATGPGAGGASATETNPEAPAAEQ